MKLMEPVKAQRQTTAGAIRAGSIYQSYTHSSKQDDQV